MSRCWKLLPLVALAALGAGLLLWRSGPTTALADVTDVTANGNVVTIQAETDDGNLVITLGSVESDTDVEMEITDCNDCDEEGDNDDTTLTIDTNDAQFTDGTVQVTLTMSCPDTDAITVTATQGATSDSATVVCSPTTQTPTGTVGAARTVTVQSSSATLGCNNTSIITILVKDASGNPVASGTTVNVSASIGTVSPASGQTTADGSVFVFYTAPASSGGTATITATASGASGSVQVLVSCNPTPAATATTAPPPTVASGSITPPSTGDGGVGGGTSWQTYAVIVVIVASLTAALAVTRSRA